MHVEAMNFGGTGHAKYVAALGLSPHSMHISHDAVDTPRTRWIDFPLLARSARRQLGSAANCMGADASRLTHCQIYCVFQYRYRVARLRLRTADVMNPRHHHAPQPLIGRLQRAMARNLAIQLRRPTWHLCWTPEPARSPEPTALGAAASWTS